jgi:replication factor C subunit 1
MKTKETDPIDKRKRAEMYKSYMNRGGPSAPGSKTIPDGEENCLKNLTFVISGKILSSN